jgi:hypothetical protein
MICIFNSVPISLLPAMVAVCRKDFDASGLLVGVNGHVGDSE